MCFYFIFFKYAFYVFMYAFYIKGNCGFVKSKTFISVAFYKTCPWSTDAVINSTAIFVAIAIVWVKIIHFYFMPKIIWMLSKDCVP